MKIWDGFCLNPSLSDCCKGRFRYKFHSENELVEISVRILILLSSKYIKISQLTSATFGKGGDGYGDGGKGKDISLKKSGANKYFDY